MKKWIYRIVFVVSLCVFGYSAYNLWDIYSQKQQVATQTKQLEKKVIKKKNQKTSKKHLTLKIKNDILITVSERKGKTKENLVL